ncbi:hypothetical protein WICPIJ_004596 [Wickerhamomyces pijperi]|uniref:J domain-containing protein n=1 Tax=Wickerhamomyces pijperi TaxID=599730 RepID=A0A9P8TMR0_WICPI|nr:hypothetical protein WICPIJ_004596 [Wickerhamomyces pijperi]
MRLTSIFYTLFLVTLALCAFSPEEIELFETQNKLTKDFKEASFYTFFQISPSASTKTIIKNYKKLSRKYHPDKIKKATKKDVQRYELLNVVYDVLKSGRREKYDFYLQRGFPKYDKADMKFKSRVFKPSFVFISLFLLLVLSVLHYMILKINYSSQVDKLQRIIDEIRTAGSNSKIEEISEERRITSQELQKDFLVRIDGIFMIDHDENNNEVFIRLTTDDIPEPAITDVFTINAVLRLWNKTNIYPIDLERKIVKKENDYQPLVKEEKKQKKRTKLPNGKIVYK